MKSRYYLSVCSLFVLIVLMPSCLKSKSSWQDYGDYYSFDEGFRFDGEEYHKELYINWIPASNRRLFLLAVADSIMTMHYSSWRLSSEPRGGHYAYLMFDLVIDSCLFRNDRKWKMVRMDSLHNASFVFDDEPIGVVQLDSDFFPPDWYSCDIQGWISFSIGDVVKEYKDNNLRYYKCPECLFEFELTGPD
ncbi:MAG: hypothetical protein IKZ60_01595, partial [Bacteroidales bacterium]|nr:hypothetical protein [Bacteroidales bacterium]